MSKVVYGGQVRLNREGGLRAGSQRQTISCAGALCPERGSDLEKKREEQKSRKTGTHAQRADRVE